MLVVPVKMRRFLATLYIEIGIKDLIGIFAGAFDDADVIHVEGEVDPVRDLDIISEELRLKDEEKLNKNMDKFAALQRGGDKKLKPEYVSLRV